MREKSVEAKALEISFTGEELSLERLMCEVEFWEVFLMQGTKVF